MLIKYTGKYVKIYFIIKITCLTHSVHDELSRLCAVSV